MRLIIEHFFQIHFPFWKWVSVVLIILTGGSRAQALVSASEVGLLYTQDNEAEVFSNENLQLSFIPGYGWNFTEGSKFPAPQNGKLPLEVVNFFKLTRVPAVSVRSFVQRDRLRLVFDLPQGIDWQPQPEPLEAFEGPQNLSLPLFVVPADDDFSTGLLRGTSQTLLRINVPPNRFYRKRSMVLQNPLRLVVDYYSLELESNLEVAPGFTYKEYWGFASDPIRFFVLEAAVGSWRMEPVGTPGRKQALPVMAPGALGVLNGGYFDQSNGLPIGLWIRRGNPVNSIFGRGTLFWDDENLDLTIPKYQAFVENQEGKKLRVGVNLHPSRYTVYNFAGKVGLLGENALVVQDGFITATLPAPVNLQDGQWALTYPASEAALAPTGAPLKVVLNTDPVMSNALEAGPILIKNGENVFGKTGEVFNDKAPLIKVTQQSVVAWTKEGELWFVTSDAATPDLLAKILLERGAWGAIRMDAGGSAQLWVEGKLVNRSDVGFRQVVSGLAIYPK